MSFKHAIGKKKKCINCGVSFISVGINQKRCGSVKNKTGCSWKNHKFLLSRSAKTGELRESYFRNKTGFFAGHPIKEKLLKKYSDKCPICNGNEKLEVNHIIPKCVGGTDNEDNLEILCHKCNLSEYNRIVFIALKYFFENANKKAISVCKRLDS